jgi:hypothetical protein
MKLKAATGVRWEALKREDEGEGPPSGASDEMLALINQRPEVIVSRTRENVFVRRAWAVHDGPLYGGRLKLSTQMVKDLGRMGLGVKLMANHDTGMFGGMDALPVGFIFRGGAEVADGKTWAVYDLAIPRTPKTQELVMRLDGGAISELSVQVGYKEMRCSVCGGDPSKCPHVPGEKECLAELHGAEELVELSLVWSGKAPGTRMAIAASRDAEFTPLDSLLAKVPADPMAGYFTKEATGAKEPPMSHLFAQA